MRVRKTAMTLIEVILSLGILAVLMMAILSLLPTSRLAVKRAQVRIRADAEAQSQLEKLRAQSFDSLAARDLGDLSLAGLPVFHRKLEVVPNGRTKELRVTVAWEWSSQLNSVRHSLLICDLPR